MLLATYVIVLLILFLVNMTQWSCFCKQFEKHVIYVVYTYFLKEIRFQCIWKDYSIVLPDVSLWNEAINPQYPVLMEREEKNHLNYKYFIMKR
jgi:hypothetical protein